MEKIGVIRSCNGKWADVAVLRDASCGDNCGACKLCPERESVVRVLNPIGAPAGARVKIMVSSKSVLLMTFVAYILPVLLAVAAYFVLGLFWGGAAQEIGTFAVLILLILAFYKGGGKIFGGERFQSRVFEVIEGEGE